MSQRRSSFHAAAATVPLIVTATRTTRPAGASSACLTLLALWLGAAGSAVAQTYLLNEGFEGAGYQNPGWTAFGAIDPDYTASPLVGAQSLRCSGASSFLQRPLTPGSTVHCYFQVRWLAYAPFKFVVDWLDAGSVSIARVVTDGFPNRLSLFHGGASAVGTTVLATNTTYHVWVEWTRGTGNNGTMRLFLSTNSTKPASPEAVLTNGTGNATIDKFDLGPFDSAATTDVLFDRVLIDDEPIGSNPGGNSPPVISSIPNQITPVGTALGPIAFVVGDAETNANSLTITGVSSHTNVVPNANIVFGGSGSNRTVTLTPHPGITANTTITLTVSDGQAGASTTFSLAVGNANAPTLTAIANQSTTTNTPVGPIPFIIGDVETPAASLTLRGASTNTTLVPNANLVFGGSGSNRTVTVTPAANQIGVTLLTVFVSDGQLTNSTNFALTVGAANSPPTISDVPGQLTPQDTTLGPIPFTVGDAETPAASLTVTAASSNPGLLPLSGIVLGGAGASRTVTLTPAAGQSGTATVTLNVSDGSLTASDTFVFTVTATNPPGGFGDWLFREGFEGPGYENPGWTSIGTPNPDYTVEPLRDAESLRLASSSLITRAFQHTNQFALYGRLRWHSLVAGSTVFYWETAGFNAAASVLIDFTLPRLFLTHGLSSAVGSTVLQTNVNYHVWLEWSRGTGSNGVMRAFLSTTVVKPATPDAVLTNGLGGNIERLNLGSTSPTAQLIVDSLLVAAEPIGNNPDSNSRPVISDLPNQSTDEDVSTGPLAFTVGDLETAANHLTVTAVSSNQVLVPNGNIVFSGSGSNRTLVVTPAANQFGTATIAVIVSDASLTNTDTFVLTVNPVNDAPLVRLPVGATNYVENSAPVVLDPSATLTDDDSPNLGGGTLTVDLPANGSPDDRLAVRHEGAGPGQVGVNGTNVTYEGNVIAAFVGGDGTTPLIVTFNAAATPLAAQAVLRNLTFENVSDLPSTNARTVRVVADDGDAGVSAPAAMTLNVTGLLDVPGLVWTEPPPIVYGTPLGAAQLNATAGIPGVFNYTPPAGTVLPAGSGHTLAVAFTPADTVNYRPTNASVTLNVLPAALRVRASAASRPYGQTNPPFTVTYSGFVNGDTPTNLSGELLLLTPANSNSPVGRYPVTPFGLTATNYDLSFIVGTLTITSLPLVATADHQTKPYGAPLPALTGTLDGLRRGDNIAATFTTPATAVSDAGSYPIVPVLADPDNRLANYALVASNGTLTITPVPLLIAADDQARPYGAANPPFTATYSGFVNGDDPSDLDTPVSLSTLANATSPAGAYPIAATGAADRNYAIAFTNGVLTVTPAALVVTAHSTNRLYGQTNPPFTATITGFVNDDDATSLGGALVFTTSAETNSPVGEYAITPAGLSASTNYALRFVEGTLTVTTAPLFITANAASRPYGQTNPIFTATYSGFLNGDNQTNLSGELLLLTPADTNSPVGRYPIAPFGLASTNYDLHFIVGALTITPAPLIASAHDQTHRHGTSLPPFTGTLLGVRNGDNISVTFTAAVHAASGAGLYPITPVLADPDNKLANYTVELRHGTLTVVLAGPLAIQLLRGPPSGEATLRVTSDPGQRLTLQWTTNFLSWTNLATLLNATGTLDHLDTTSAGQPHRFYRAVLAPE
jgi:hypothetical protein